MHSRFLLVAFASLVALLALPGNADSTADSSKNTLVFGVVPQQSAEKLALVWNPFLEYLSDKSGQRIIFGSAPDIETFNKQAANGDFDLVYIDPLVYTAVHYAVGYQVFAKEKDTQLTGILVVQKSSPYQKLEDLIGKTIAFPGPNAFAATLLPLAEFKTKGINIAPVYIGSHEGVYNDVARGLYVAGGGVAKTLAQTDSMVRNELRVLWTSDNYTPHPFAAHPRVDPALVQRLAKIMFELDQDERGKKLLKELRFHSFVSAQDQEYEKHRSLRKSYTTMGE